LIAFSELCAASPNFPGEFCIITRLFVFLKEPLDESTEMQCNADLEQICGRFPKKVKVLEKRNTLLFNQLREKQGRLKG